MNPTDHAPAPEPDGRDLEAVVAAARRGDRGALDHLIRRHLPQLQAFVRLRAEPAFRARESAADVVQTVCRQALEHLAEFEWRGPDSFRNWLFAQAVNQLRNRRHYHRADCRDPDREAPRDAPDHAMSQLYASVCSPSQHAAANEWARRLEDAMGRLPEDHREVIALSRMLGMSHRDIAVQLGLTEVAVRSRLSRALGRLATLLDRE